MIVLHEGKLPEPKQPWWVGKRAHCSCCLFRGLLEAHDQILGGMNERRPGGKQEIRLECPSCGAHILVTNRDL